MNLSIPGEVFQRHQRQVHLGFHHSPLIPDVGSEFDPAEFARALARARVNSVTVFAKCRHGISAEGCGRPCGAPRSKRR